MEAGKCKLWLQGLALCIVLGLCAAVAFSQGVAGRLTGSVVDSTGAVIPGATVNVYLAGGKDPVLTGQTNNAGIFLFPAVRPETYDIVIEAQGFSKNSIRSAKVSPLQEYTLGEIKLGLLSVIETVDVTADPVAVNVTNAEINETITSEQVQNLPVLGRQVSNLFQMMPGVSQGSVTTSVNGLKSSFSVVTLDGINIQDNYVRGNSLDYAPMRTTIDQVAEISVSTSNESAGIGGGSSQFTLVTKAGSNTYHGSVYWYNRNSALAANDWFNNAYGLDPTRVNLNQPGLALGGHIIKDKLFFYTNYEWYRNKMAEPYTRTTLTDSAKQGIFTDVDTGVTRQTPLSKLRSFTVDPTVKAMMSQLPSPNATGGDGLNTGGYRFNARENEFRDQFVYKSDYYLNSRHSISGTYDYIDNPTDRPDQGAFYTFVPPVSNLIKDHLMSLGWRWTASPTLTNEARGGFMRSDTGFYNGNDYPKFQLSGLLFSNPVNTFMEQGRFTNTYNFQDNANWLKGKHQVSFGYQDQIINATAWNDASILPTYTLGISAANSAVALTAADLPGIKSGSLSNANKLLANMAGYITSASQAFNATSATSGYVPGANNTRGLSYDTHSLYIQDSWRVRPTLTLNLGVRYEYWTPVSEKDKLFLEPLIGSKSVKDALLDPNNTIDFYGGQSSLYHSDKNNFGPNIGFAWSPLVNGTRRLTVRGGYMIAYVNDNVINSVRNAANTTVGLASTASITNRTEILAAAPTIPTPVYKVPRTVADNYAISPSNAQGLVDPNLATPMVHQWNLTVQEEVKGFVFEGRYMGNTGRNLLRGVDYNQVLYNANGFLADFRRAQGNAALSEAAGLGYIGAYNSALLGSQQLTVFPLLANGGSLSTASSVYNSTYLREGRIGEMASLYMTNKANGSVNFYPNPYQIAGNALLNDAVFNYHALQLVVTKRTRSGLQAQFSYTLGKSLGTSSGDGSSNFEALLDNANPSLEYARTPYDIQHVLKANYYYELPFGKGKKFSAGPIVDHLIGGWAISGFWNYQSGAPYSMLSGRGTLNRDARSGSANTASVYGMTMSELNPLTSGIWKQGDGTVTFVDPALIGPDGRGAAQAGSPAFDGQVFFNPEAGTVGNTQRRMFSGPWLFSWDFSVKKAIQIKERASLDLHFDFFNVLNHPAFNIYGTSTNGDYSNSTYSTINNTTFGQVDYTQYDPRIIQIGAYFRF